MCDVSLQQEFTIVVVCICVLKPVIFAKINLQNLIGIITFASVMRTLNRPPASHFAKQLPKMDIVSRLKIFLNHLGIQVTQFADICSIPRPTMSQLLNGRNKKVSNELIGKIHTAYPELSVLWLMFGQGDMLADGFTPTSEPKITSTINFEATKSHEPELHDAIYGYENNAEDFSSKKNSGPSINHVPVIPSTSSKGMTDAVEDPTVASDGALFPDDPDQSTSDHTKKVVNIIVYYSDNSFESFIPGKF